MLCSILVRPIIGLPQAKIFITFCALSAAKGMAIKMEDIELVLRFFALDNGNYSNLRKGFKKFLSEEMAKMNKFDEEILKRMCNKFQSVMKIILDYFGSLAFVKYRFDGENFIKISNFNAAVLISNMRYVIKQRFYKLFWRLINRAVGNHLRIKCQAR